MKSMVPKTIAGLLLFAKGNGMGASKMGYSIGLAQNTDVAMKADIEPVYTAIFRYEDARTILRQNYDILNEKTEAAKSIATITREILKLKLGSHYSERWLGTGFDRA